LQQDLLTAGEPPEHEVGSRYHRESIRHIRDRISTSGRFSASRERATAA